jgi:hypothetical protein
MYKIKLFFKLPPYTLAGFDLATLKLYLISSVASGDDKRAPEEDPVQG